MDASATASLILSESRVEKYEFHAEGDGASPRRAADRMKEATLRSLLFVALAADVQA
jgi:hypothetical protein